MQHFHRQGNRKHHGRGIPHRSTSNEGDAGCRVFLGAGPRCALEGVAEEGEFTEVIDDIWEGSVGHETAALETSKRDDDRFVDLEREGRIGSVGGAGNVDAEDVRFVEGGIGT